MFGRALTPEEILVLREEQIRRDTLAKTKKRAMRIREPRHQHIPIPRKTRAPINPRGMMHDFLHQMKPVKK